MLASAPAFLPFAILTLVLVFHLLALWAWSGVVRGKTKTVMNAEDSEAWKQTLVEQHPHEVARVLRAHANASANAIPFLLLALLFVLEGGGATFAWAVFGTFALVRLVYVWAYLGGKQPWRTLMFILGLVATVVLSADIVSLLVQA